MFRIHSYYDYLKNNGPEKLFELKKEINEYRIREEVNNYKLISKKVNEDAGSFVKIYGDIGILCTAIIDLDDFYYVLMDKDRKLTYHSCCCKYEIIPQEEVGPEFSILNWIRENQPEELLKIIQESIERNEVIPISAIRVIKTG